MRVNPTASETETNGVSDTRSRPLRVGLLVDSLTQQQWVYDIVEELQRSSFAQIVLVIENGDVDRPERGFARRLTRNRKRLAYVLYTRIDEYLFRQQPDAFTETSITDLVAGVPTIRVTPIKKRFSDYFAAEDVAAIREHELDVAFRLGFRILRGDSLRIARHGVWSYHHGDNLVNRGGPAGFWEVMNQEPATGSVLQVLTDELDNGRVIYRSHAPTDPRSVYRNKDNFYRKSASFVGRKLKDLAERGAPALADDRPSDAFVPYTRPIYREPGNLEMVSHGVRLAGRYAADKLRDVWYLNQWSIAYRLHPGSDGPDPGLHRFKLLRPPADRFWADPFPVSADGLHYIFVEELPFSTNKGHISVLELDASGQLRGTAKVLEKDHHLSYPFVFEWRGERFMIPETGANRSIEVYRAHAFPHQWQLEQILMDDIYAVDATLLELDGAWWMFANVAADGVVNTDELHIFKAPTPFGPWSAHRRNPVKSDGRCARPAEAAFSVERTALPAIAGLLRAIRRSYRYQRSGKAERAVTTARRRSQNRAALGAEPARHPHPQQRSRRDRRGRAGEAPPLGFRLIRARRFPKRGRTEKRASTNCPRASHY